MAEELSPCDLCGGRTCQNEQADAAGPIYPFQPRSFNSRSLVGVTALTTETPPSLLSKTFRLAFSFKTCCWGFRFAVWMPPRLSHQVADGCKQRCLPHYGYAAGEAGRGGTIFPLPSSRSDGEPSDDVTGSCCSLLSFAK